MMYIRADVSDGTRFSVPQIKQLIKLAKQEKHRAIHGHVDISAVVRDSSIRVDECHVSYNAMSSRIMIVQTKQLWLDFDDTELYLPGCSLELPDNLTFCFRDENYIECDDETQMLLMLSLS